MESGEYQGKSEWHWLIQFVLDFDRSYSQTSEVGEIAYLSLGSNLGDRASCLRTAIASLSQHRPPKLVSAFYETQPVGITAQSWFLNCVVAIEMEGSPRDLLKSILSIEAAMGRVRSRPKGSRNIDIDILLFGDRIMDEPGLTVPHPSMHERRFVLEPLSEIAPEVRHPILKKTARELLSALEPGQIVRRLEEPSGKNSQAGSDPRTALKE